MTESTEDAVVVAPSRTAAVVVGMVFLLLAGSLGRYLLQGPEGSTVGWVVAVLLLLTFVGIGVASLRGATRRDRLLLDAGGLTQESGGTAHRTTLADVQRVEFHPAEATTWTGPERPGEPRLLSRSRMEARLRVTGTGVDRSLRTSQPAWADAVAVVHGWVRERPDLVADDVTRTFFAGLTAAASPHRSTRRRWLVASAVLWAAATTSLVVLAGVHDLPLGPRAIVGYVIGGLALTGVVAYAVGTSLPVLQALVRLLRGDPWWLFRPRPDGRYAWLVSGRMSSLRAPRGGSLLGLVVRWGMTLALLVVAWLPLVMVLRLARLVVDF